MRYRCDNKLAFDAALTDIQAQFGKTGYLDIRTSGKRRSLGVTSIQPGDVNGDRHGE